MFVCVHKIFDVLKVKLGGVRDFVFLACCSMLSLAFRFKQIRIWLKSDFEDF